jgi:hypothetical protein
MVPNRIGPLPSVSPWIWSRGCLRQGRDGRVAADIAQTSRGCSPAERHTHEGRRLRLPRGSRPALPAGADGMAPFGCRLGAMWPVS